MATSAVPRESKLGFSLIEASRLYGIDPSKFRSAILRGDLPAARLGRRRFLLLRTDVENWIRRQGVKKTRTPPSCEAMTA